MSRTLSHPSSIPESGQSASLEYVKVLEERLKNFEKRIDELENTLAEWRTLDSKPQTQLDGKEMNKGVQLKMTQVESRDLISEEAHLKEQQLTEEGARKASEDEGRHKRRADTTKMFSGVLSMARRKEELEELAAALALSDSGKKEELLERVCIYFEEHPEVKTSPRFDGLFNPRPRKRLRMTETPVPGPSNIHESVAQAPLSPSTFPGSSAFKFQPIVPCFTPGRIGRSNRGHELVNHPYFRNGGYYPFSQ